MLQELLDLGYRRDVAIEHIADITGINLDSVGRCIGRAEVADEQRRRKQLRGEAPVRS